MPPSSAGTDSYRPTASPNNGYCFVYHSRIISRRVSGLASCSGHLSLHKRTRTSQTLRSPSFSIGVEFSMVVDLRRLGFGITETTLRKKYNEKTFRARIVAHVQTSDVDAFQVGMIDFGMSHSASYSPLLEDSNLKSDEMNSSKDDNDNSLPLNTSNDDNDDDGSGGGGGGGEQTSECKRDSENRHLSDNTIATELPLDAYGFPLAIFTKGSVLHPYLSLPYMDWLESDHVRAYVVGFTNTLFKQKKELFDAMITIDEENGIDIEIPDVRLRRLLVLSAADLRFIDGVLKTAFQDDSSISQFTKWEGGDEWIRFQFSQYLISLLLTAASDDTSYYDDFNAAFVHSYKTTHNFLLWYSGGFHKQMNFPAGHICHGQLNLADFKLRFTHTIESSDQARKLQHALNTTGNFVNQTGKAVGTEVYFETFSIILHPVLLNAATLHNVIDSTCK
ncbi:protein KIAA0241-like protein [Trichinella spiralis]|uniref:protein KIAA0241-like protein n=1 Tax=Trichinella spiralis TaxID=6334 RepID=UPI0001EFB6B3|nr:protein KIAA0241-like protein [Trichinella spiralis]